MIKFFSALALSLLLAQGSALALEKPVLPNLTLCENTKYARFNWQMDTGRLIFDVARDQEVVSLPLADSEETVDLGSSLLFLNGTLNAHPTDDTGLSWESDSITLSWADKPVIIDSLSWTLDPGQSSTVASERKPATLSLTLVSGDITYTKVLTCNHGKVFPVLAK